MARPLKQGLSYFPLDVDFFSDEKISAISGEFGIKGEIVAIKLLCAIYRNGYFVEWNKMLRMRLLKELPGISEDLLQQIVDRLVKWGFFDKDLFNSSVLTSRGIQSRYFSIAHRRIMSVKDLPFVIENGKGVSDSNNPPAREFLSAETREENETKNFHGVSVGNNRVSVDRNHSTAGFLYAKTPKEKESKVKKENDGKESPPATPPLNENSFKKSFEENARLCLESPSWQESILRMLDVKTFDFKAALDDFKGNLTRLGREGETATIREFRSHFTFWLQKITEIKKNGKTKTLVGNDRKRVCTSVGGEAFPSAQVVPGGRGVSVI